MFCRHCGQEINDKAVICVHCQAQLAPIPAPPNQNLGDDAGMRILMPVGRSGFAIAAGYLGLFSVLLFPAPLAIIFGIIAVIDINRHQEKHGLGRAYFGIIMGCLCSFALIAFLRNYLS